MYKIGLLTLLSIFCVIAIEEQQMHDIYILNPLIVLKRVQFIVHPMLLIKVFCMHGIVTNGKWKLTVLMRQIKLKLIAFMIIIMAIAIQPYYTNW